MKSESFILCPPLQVHLQLQFPNLEYGRTKDNVSLPKFECLHFSPVSSTSNHIHYLPIWLLVKRSFKNTNFFCWFSKSFGKGRLFKILEVQIFLFCKCKLSRASESADPLSIFHGKAYLVSLVVYVTLTAASSSVCGCFWWAFFQLASLFSFWWLSRVFFPY